MFLVIIVIIVILQLLLVTFAGSAFGVYPNFGLAPGQWGISILIGSFGLIVSVILKLLPFARHEDHNAADKGFGNKKSEVRKGSRVISLKRI
jgi:uncharacterized membrane protein